MKKPEIYFSPAPVIEPKVGCDWADTMVLNPALMLDEDCKTIHMLFRATGPWKQKNLQGLSAPYPIFLGYAKSEDFGESFEAHFSKPALSPRVEYKRENMYVTDYKGEIVLDYANGCVEDPRIFKVEGKTYLTVASRLFPPGPYWEKDARRDNLPDWVATDQTNVGVCARRNDTVTVLYELDESKLISGDYENAFTYVCPLTDGALSDNRDVFFFPKRFKIQGKEQLLMLHRPDNPSKFQGVTDVTTPSIMLAAAESFEDFATEEATNQLLATSQFDWEEERVGASFPPIDLGNGKWLISYHGKQLPDYGYTQSFMILQEQEDDFPKIINRMSDRLIYAKQSWELPDKFPCPCIFTTGGVIVDDTLIMGYGAADQKIGIAKVCLSELVKYVETFDENGKQIGELM